VPLASTSVTTAGMDGTTAGPSKVKAKRKKQLTGHVVCAAAVCGNREDCAEIFHSFPRARPLCRIDWKTQQKASEKKSAVPSMHLSTPYLTLDKKIKAGKCSQCGCNSGDLKRHVESVHLQLKRHQCTQCTYAVYSKSDLVRHTKRVHENIRNHECDRCDFSSALLRDLNQHAKMKVLKCTYCEYTAADWSIVSQHVKSVHFKSRLKCDKAALCHETLKQHKMKAHGETMRRLGITTGIGDGRISIKYVH
jgi:hypothetical protein